LMEAGDRKGMVRAYEEWSMPSVHIRNLSLKHLPLIATHLEPDERHAFEAKFEELLYHDLYAPARVDLLLGKGLKRDDLTDAQRSRLQAIAASIEVKRSAERARLKQMQDERSSEAGTRRWAEHRTEMLLSGQGTRMSPEDISYHNELLPAYRAVGSEFEEEILRILGEEGE
jgi:hypothetical protein